MADDTPTVKHTLPSPFPRSDARGTTVTEERCRCGHLHHHHEDTVEGYGLGTCGARHGRYRACCSCTAFVYDRAVHRLRKVLTKRTSMKKLNARLGCDGPGLVYGTRNKLRVSVRDEYRDPKTHAFTDVDLAAQPPRTHERRGTQLGLGADPAFIVALRITAALDPTQAPGKVRTLADMSAEERERLGAPCGLVAGAPPPPRSPPSAHALANLRLGPVSDYIIRPHGPRTCHLPRRLLFSVNNDWHALRDIAHRLHVRREKFMEAYSLGEEKWKQVLAWGVREANRIEQTMVLRHR
jgi:hypothetical protein